MPNESIRWNIFIKWKFPIKQMSFKHYVHCAVNFYENAKYLFTFLIVIDLWSLFKFIRLKIGSIGNVRTPFLLIIITVIIMKMPPKSFSLESSKWNEMKYETNVDLLIKWQWTILSVQFGCCSWNARDNSHIFVFITVDRSQ